MLVGDYPSSEMHYLLEIVLQAARALRLVSTHTHVIPLNTLSRGPREGWLGSPLDEQRRRAREAFHTLFHGREHPVGKSSPSIVPRHTRINVQMVHGACLCSRYLQSVPRVTSPGEHRFTTMMQSVRPFGLAMLPADPPAQPPRTSTRNGKELSGRSDLLTVSRLYKFKTVS